jgi:hypothetical protein
MALALELMHTCVRMRAALALLFLALAGCISTASSGLGVHVAHLPPDRTDILEALILSEAVSLTGDPGCAWAGEGEDRTLGRYLAGLFTGPYQSYTDEPGENWIEIATKPEPADAGALWRSRVLVHAGAREPQGLEFLIRQSDGLVLADSFRCVQGS